MLSSDPMKGVQTFVRDARALFVSRNFTRVLIVDIICII